MPSLTRSIRPAASTAPRALAIVAAACVGSLTAGVGPALAAFPGANGAIAFVSDRPIPGQPSNDNIWTMRPDGRRLVNLTPSSPASDGNPNWRADGRKIVFESDRETPENPVPSGFESPDFEIFTMNADGSDVRQITFNELDDEDPAWSPDGRHIVLARDLDPVRGQVNYEIFTMTASGGDERNITNDPDPLDGLPNWSPDGQRIAFTSNRDGDAEIYTVNVDGWHVQQLTDNDTFDGAPNWSPSGRKLSFQSYRAGQLSIYTMRRDGGHQERLTYDAPDAFASAWSPDGCLIVYSSFANPEIFAITVDGTDPRNLTSDPAFDFVPDWQPLDDHHREDDDHGRGHRDQADGSSCRS
jgi:Tol biopolymer transport system component